MSLSLTSPAPRFSPPLAAVDARPVRWAAAPRFGAGIGSAAGQDAVVLTAGEAGPAPTVFWPAFFQRLQSALRRVWTSVQSAFEALAHRGPAAKTLSQLRRVDDPLQRFEAAEAVLTGDRHGVDVKRALVEHLGDVLAPVDESRLLGKYSALLLDEGVVSAEQLVACGFDEIDDPTVQNRVLREVLAQADPDGADTGAIDLDVSYDLVLSLMDIQDDVMRGTVAQALVASEQPEIRALMADVLARQVTAPETVAPDKAGFEGIFRQLVQDPDPEIVYRLWHGADRGQSLLSLTADLHGELLARLLESPYTVKFCLASPGFHPGVIGEEAFANLLETAIEAAGQISYGGKFAVLAQLAPHVEQVRNKRRKKALTAQLAAAKS